MKTFKEYNANPNGENIDDCVIRAISLVLHMDYWDVFDSLCEYADKSKTGMEINSLGIFVAWLRDKGWEFRELTNKMTVNQFCKQRQENGDNGEYLGLVNGHMTAIINGQYWDTWNCGRYRLNFIFIKE